MESARPPLRLDKFLYFTRFAKSRSKSAALIEHGSVRIDGRPVATIHAEVRIGAVVTLAVGNKVRAIRIEDIPARRGPAPEAQACYTDLIAD